MPAVHAPVHRFRPCPSDSQQGPAGVPRTDRRREKLRRLPPRHPAAPGAYFRLQDLSRGPFYSSPSGPQDLPCPCTLPLQALGATRKGGYWLQGPALRPSGLGSAACNSGEAPMCVCHQLPARFLTDTGGVRPGWDLASDWDP